MGAIALLQRRIAVCLDHRLSGLDDFVSKGCSNLFQRLTFGCRNANASVSIAFCAFGNTGLLDSLSLRFVSKYGSHLAMPWRYSREEEVDEDKIYGAASDEDIVVVLVDVREGTWSSLSDWTMISILAMESRMNTGRTADIDNIVGHCRNSHHLAANGHRYHLRPVQPSNAVNQRICRGL